MEKTLHLTVVTPGGIVIDEQSGFAVVPAADGEMGILPNHSAMLAALTEGVMRYKVNGEEHYAALSGGTLSIADNELVVLARSAERAESIDLARAQASEKRARERIEQKAADLDLARAELSLHRALAREKAYSMLHK